jgi:hypothetical protein
MKSKKRNVEQGATVPLQVRVGGETREKLKVIAVKNGLSLNDIATMCLAAGLSKVAAKLDDIHRPDPEAEAA